MNTELNAKRRWISSLIFKYSDMNEEMTTEISEMCVTACEKFPDDNCVSHALHYFD